MTDEQWSQLLLFFYDRMTDEQAQKVERFILDEDTVGMSFEHTGGGIPCIINILSEHSYYHRYNDWRSDVGWISINVSDIEGGSCWKQFDPSGVLSIDSDVAQKFLLSLQMRML